MKTQRQIEAQLIQSVGALQNRLTNFVIGSVIRAILSAVSGVLAEIWNDIVQTKRKALLDTSTAADLDLIAVRRGMSRNGSTASSAILVFAGTPGTVVPAGTTVRSSADSLIYSTRYEITIGVQSGGITSIAIGDSVIAESLTLGSATAVQNNRLTTLVDPIIGITGVSNPAPSYGGLDAESDVSLRERIRNQVSLLNMGTQSFYEEAAKSANAHVLRARAIRDTVTKGTKLYLLKDSLAPFSTQELSGIAVYVTDKQRSGDTAACENAALTAFTVSFTATLRSGAVAADINRRIASKIANFCDLRYWQWGADLMTGDILSLLTDNDIIRINPNSFSVNGSLIDFLAIDDNSMPLFTGLTINAEGQPLTAKTYTQKYTNVV